MNALWDKFGQYQPGDVVWFTPQGTPVAAAQLAAALARLPLDDWRGKRVALGALSTLELATALIALDGVADTLLLLPAEESAEARARRLSDAAVDIVLDTGAFATPDRFPAAADLPATTPVSSVTTTWLLPTSGTTGTPKLIPHTSRSLTRNASTRHLGNQYVWGSLYSLRRFAGLQVFLQAWLAGTPLVLQDEGSELGQNIANLGACGCNALSATPSMWRKISMLPQFDTLSLRQVTLGGEIADQGVLDMLRKRMPDARIVHIYASTEAGVGFAVRDGMAGFPVSYLDGGASAVPMRIDDGHLCFLLSAPGQSEPAWVDSGDVVRVDGDRVYFLGRANGSINVGGNKVMPEEVENVIKELPEVAAVQVRARHSAMLGNLVEALVTPAPGVAFDPAFKKRVTAYCRERLEPFKVPAFVVEANDIALTASGKISRVAAK
jgi:acyl-CoA synthetase (AMP-forming)/AMP-acid ligase II